MQDDEDEAFSNDVIDFDDKRLHCPNFDMAHTIKNHDSYGSYGSIPLDKIERKAWLRAWAEYWFKNDRNGLTGDELTIKASTFADQLIELQRKRIDPQKPKKKKENKPASSEMVMPIETFNVVAPPVVQIVATVSCSSYELQLCMGEPSTLPDGRIVWGAKIDKNTWYVEPVEGEANTWTIRAPQSNVASVDHFIDAMNRVLKSLGR